MTKIQKIKKKWPALMREAGPWFLGFLLNLALSGLVFAGVEGINPFMALWWALVSGTTTGFGDVLPHVVAGYIIAAYVMLSSIVIDRIMSAKIVKVMVEEPNLYSHAEQEREEAKSNLILAILLRQNSNGYLQSMPEYELYQNALKAVKEEESDQITST